MNNEDDLDYYEEMYVESEKERIYFLLKIMKHVIEYYCFDKESVDLIFSKINAMLKELEESKKEDKKNYRKIKNYVSGKLADFGYEIDDEEEENENE